MKHEDSTWGEIIDATHEHQRLDYVWRYSSIPVLTKENVSTHSYWVAIYSILIHQKIAPKNYDLLNACVMHALMHDYVEGVTGDIVRTFKYSSLKLKSAIDEAENEIIKSMDASAQMMFRLSDELLEKSGNAEYVKAIVKTADFISLYNYMTREYSRGNREILPFYERMISDLKMMWESSEAIKISVSPDELATEFNPKEIYEQLHCMARQLIGLD